MRRHIKLSDLAHIPTPRHKEFRADLMQTGRDALVARGLRYDNATGILRDNRCGELERYSNPADHTPHETEEEVMHWEFSRYIANAASRLDRGYDA